MQSTSISSCYFQYIRNSPNLNSPTYKQITSPISKKGTFSPKIGRQTLVVVCAIHSMICWSESWSNWDYLFTWPFLGQKIWKSLENWQTGCQLYSNVVHHAGKLLQCWRKFNLGIKITYSETPGDIFACIPFPMVGFPSVGWVGFQAKFQKASIQNSGCQWNSA